MKHSSSSSFSVSPLCSAKMVVAQKLKEAEITEKDSLLLNLKDADIAEQDSLLLARNLLRIAIFNISYIRGLSPEKYFIVQSVPALEMKIKKLMPVDAESPRLMDWLEKGVYDPLQKKYLKTSLFCICEAIGGPMIEEYAFSFKSNLTDEVTPKQMKNSACKMIRNLVQLMRTLDKMPEKKYMQDASIVLFVGTAVDSPSSSSSSALAASGVVVDEMRRLKLADSSEDDDDSMDKDEDEDNHIDEDMPIVLPPVGVIPIYEQMSRQQLAAFNIQECHGFSSLARVIQAAYPHEVLAGLTYFGSPWSPHFMVALYSAGGNHMNPMQWMWKDFRSALTHVRMFPQWFCDTISLEVWENRKLTCNAAVTIPRRMVSYARAGLLRYVHMYHAAYNGIEPSDGIPLNPWPMARLLYFDHKGRPLRRSEVPSERDYPLFVMRLGYIEVELNL